MDLRRQLLQLKFDVRSYTAREPWLSPLHNLVIWWTQYKQLGEIDIRECRIGPGTEFVLDGFQGTANSFAARAFKWAQDTPVRMAHHLHAPAQIIKAVHREIPTVVTTRNPVDAVASLMSRWPYVTPRQGLRSYTRFYRKIEPYTEGVVISPFDQTTQHLDRVFGVVNDRFGTEFDVFDHSHEHVIRDPASLQTEDERRRRSRKADAKEALAASEHASLLRKARAIHQQIEARGVGR
jgi:hypothetical protein